MTKYFEWSRFKDMSSRQKSEVNTASTFTEQREKEDKERPPKDFGIKQMEDEVNIDWGKAVKTESVYDDPRRKLAKLAAAEQKSNEMKEDTATRDDLDESPEE